MHLDLVNKKHNKKKLETWFRGELSSLSKTRSEIPKIASWAECWIFKWEANQFHKFLLSLLCYSKSYKKTKEVSKMAVSFRAAKLLRLKGELRYRLNVWTLIKKIYLNKYLLWITKKLQYTYICTLMKI